MFQTYLNIFFVSIHAANDAAHSSDTRKTSIKPCIRNLIYAFAGHHTNDTTGHSCAVYYDCITVYSINDSVASTSNTSNHTTFIAWHGSLDIAVCQFQILYSSILVNTIEQSNVIVFLSAFYIDTTDFMSLTIEGSVESHWFPYKCRCTCSPIRSISFIKSNICTQLNGLSFKLIYHIPQTSCCIKLFIILNCIHIFFCIKPTKIN